MSTNEIVAVVNLLCNKLGVTVEFATPMALEVVRQYQVRAGIFAIMGGVLASTGLITIIGAKHTDSAPVFGILGLALLVFGCILFGANLGNYYAPLCGLIGK